MIKCQGSKPGTVVVVFQLPNVIRAQRAAVVGDFNGWNRSSHPMSRTADNGVWQATVELQKGKSYQFRYLVDDAVWHNDWNADRYVTNPFGGENSVLET
jgi:1,4-alpha-glucan branching enzyme